jgi:cyclic pyranopterin phosphate synthase
MTLVAAFLFLGHDTSPGGVDQGLQSEDARVSSQSTHGPLPADTSMGQFSHFNSDGDVHMVNVGDKPATRREATLRAILQGNLSKGDVLQVARLAGIMAAKQTSQLIPLCHPLALTGVEVVFTPKGSTTLEIRSTVSITGPTGVEMEALTAVSIAALTVYDMCKSVDRAMIIESIQLDEKSGGKSGHYLRAEA